MSDVLLSEVIDAHLRQAFKPMERLRVRRDRSQMRRIVLSLFSRAGWNPAAARRSHEADAMKYAASAHFNHGAKAAGFADCHINFDASELERAIAQIDKIMRRGR